MYFVKTPAVIKPLYRDLVWKIPCSDKVVYLTFDDGPTPNITDQTFEILAQHNAKATFFLVGSNVEKHPDYLNQYIQLGHRIGNHTHTHLNGWKTPTENYIPDVEEAKKHIQSGFFRPPYGKIKREQAKVLKNDYQLIMWDVLSGDFDPKVSVRQCIKNVVDNVEPGSIVVLHDSIKASKTMLAALPEILLQLSDKGYRFEALP